MTKRNPHHLRHRLFAMMSSQGVEVSLDEAGRLLASMTGQSDWQCLLDEWGTASMPADDRTLGSGAVMARRSRQLEVLRSSGLGLAAAIDVVYGLHPTSELPPGTIDPQMIAAEGHAVCDGFFVRLRVRGGRWTVEGGLGRIGPDGLVVQCLKEEVEVAGGVTEAARHAAHMLAAMVEAARQTFIERRSYFSFPAGSLIDTVAGSMDAFEMISPGIGRAFVSGSGEMGCYVIAPAEADRLPAFAVVERDDDGRCYLDAEGMGLVVPVVFPDLFTEHERAHAAARLEADHPLTFAVLSGGLFGKANFDAIMMEWDDEHEAGSLPEFMLVRPLERPAENGELLVLGVRTDDVLARRAIAEGHLFVMPAADFLADKPIDPQRHRRVRSESMSVTLFRHP